MRYLVQCKNCGAKTWMKGHPSGVTGVELRESEDQFWDDKITNLDCEHFDIFWDVLDEETE